LKARQQDLLTHFHYCLQIHATNELPHKQLHHQLQRPSPQCLCTVHFLVYPVRLADWNKEWPLQVAHCKHTIIAMSRTSGFQSKT